MPVERLPIVEEPVEELPTLRPAMTQVLIADRDAMEVSADVHIGI